MTLRANSAIASLTQLEFKIDEEQMMKRMHLVVFVLLFVFVANRAAAQDKSKPAMWKWTSSSSSDSKESTMFNGPQINWPQMPTFQGVKNSTSRAFTSVKQTTGRAWNSTVSFLNPWDEESKSKSKSSNSGGSWFFQKKEETKTYGSVNEFLRQERPKW
ncbi:MAG: hypothetical protein U0930_21935 [Pirellulales bacterium]